MESEAASKRLKGKVAIITGGASGIGATTCKLFVEHGAFVVIGDIQDELGVDLVNQLGSSAFYLHCDVALEADVEAIVAHTLAKYGCVDIMFCNAGISPLSNVTASICDMTMDDFQLAMDVNAKGVVLGIKHAARAMRGITTGSKHKVGGSIICNASAITQLSSGRSHAYCISKYAVMGAMRSAASELCKYGIRVNAISPFIVDTPLAERVAKQAQPDIVLSKVIPSSSSMLGAHVTTNDIAHAVLFLASDDTHLINGQNLVVDGGFCISKRVEI